MASVNLSSLKAEIEAVVKEATSIADLVDKYAQVLKNVPGVGAAVAPELAVLEALEYPLVRDELIERADLSAQDAGIALTSLLIRGLINERLGKIERV